MERLLEEAREELREERRERKDREQMAPAEARKSGDETESLHERGRRGGEKEGREGQASSGRVKRGWGSAESGASRLSEASQVRCRAGSGRSLILFL